MQLHESRHFQLNLGLAPVLLTPVPLVWTWGKIVYPIKRMNHPLRKILAYLPRPRFSYLCSRAPKLSRARLRRAPTRPSSSWLTKPDLSIGLDTSGGTGI